MAGMALVFAGQGGQFVGMGKDLAEAYPECREVFEKADSVLGQGISKICFEGPEEMLTRSDFCQPAIFTASVACYRALIAKSGKKPEPVAVAGLSLGEWTALHIAGAVSFEDTIKILSARGRFMQEACDANPGAMVSVIGLDPERLSGICETTGVGMANINSREQIVLSGGREAILKAEEAAKAAGAKKTVILKVAGAYHSPLMSSAADKLQALLAGVKFSNPEVPVLSNVTGMPHESAATIADTMVKQVVSSVKWLSCVEWMKNNGTASYLEMGPGRVLSGLIKRIDSSAEVNNIQDVPSLQKTCEVLR